MFQKVKQIIKDANFHWKDAVYVTLIGIVMMLGTQWVQAFLQLKEVPMFVLAIIVAIAIYAFREQIADWVVAMWEDDKPDE